MDIYDKQIEVLTKEIKALNITNKKIASFWWTVLRGIAYGFGVVLGTAILTAFSIFILIKIEGWAYIGRYAANILDIIRQGK